MACFRSGVPTPSIASHPPPSKQQSHIFHKNLIPPIYHIFMFLFVFARIIPESPRWLIAKNRLDEAHELLMKYARKNRVDIDSAQLKHAIQEFKKEEDRNGIRLEKTTVFWTCSEPEDSEKGL